MVFEPGVSPYIPDDACGRGLLALGGRLSSARYRSGSDAAGRYFFTAVTMICALKCRNPGSRIILM